MIHEMDATWNEFPYGHVDGERPEKRGDRQDVDPFENLLGICRVMGLVYEVRESPAKRWSATLISRSWPGDFYGGAGTQTRRRSYTVCNCDSRLDALSSVIPMAVGGLWGACEAWRSIVSRMPEYESWFKESSQGGDGKP